MKRVLAIILGGGAGTRLQPLTLTRAKPAVPLGGNYRLIDIPISNCINSGISKIYALTQFNSQSLNRHISLTYNLSSAFNGGFVEVLAAQQTPDSPSWFQGTADAVRQYRELIEAWDVDQLLILSGDQLYRMDYQAFIEAHRASGAALTVAALPVDAATAEGFGLMRTDADGQIREFREKPTGEALEAMRVIDRLEPLHPSALALFAMEDGVPVASAPVGSARSAAAGGRIACCWSPGCAIEPEVLTDPYRALGSHGSGVVSTASRKTLAAGHLDRRAGGEQFRLVELNQQGVDRQALHSLVGALHCLLIPLPGRMAEVLHRGVALADLLEGVAGEVAAAIEGEAHAADAADPLGLGR